ncbi:hypothetical protein [Rhodopila sp.]|uniref:hypothetical protein n=1 Tax=Rhodopila sp. TaxID=2480087 RepID=UPI003D117117
MASISRDLHDRCIAAFAAIKARDPDLAAQALARGVPLTIGSPAHALMQDLLALDAVASAFATGVRPRAAQMKRALALTEVRA